MARYRLITMVNAKQGREAEMNDWYDRKHVPDILTLPGVETAQRFRVRNAVMPGEPLCEYVNVFEIETDEPMSVLAEATRRSESGEFEMSDAFELVSLAIYEAHSVR